MADPWQLALLKRDVQEWNRWRDKNPDVVVNLFNADLTGADLSFADLNRAHLSGAKRDTPPPKGTTHEPQPSHPSSTTDWLSLVETVGSNLFLAAATLVSIIQGLDVVERRWREHKKKQQQHSAQTPQPSPGPSAQSAASLSHKKPTLDKEIIEIRLVMDDGSRHGFTRWVSDPDALRAYIDAFCDPTSKVKPLQVVFMKREGPALVVDVTSKLGQTPAEFWAKLRKSA